MNIATVDLLISSMSFWILLGVAIVLIYQWWKKPHPNFPPLIRGIPGLGVVPYFDSYPQKILKKWSLDMNEPVIAVRMGNRDAVIINTYDAAFEIFSRQGGKVGARTPIFVYDQVVQDKGVVFKNTVDETQKILRSFFLKFMKKGFGVGKSGAAMESVINEETDNLISELKCFAGKPIDIKLFIYRHTLNLIAKVAAGKHYEHDDPTMEALLERFSYLISESEDASKIVHLNIFPSLRYLPNYRRVNEKAKKYMKLVHSEYIEPLIKEHRANLNPGKPKDMIDELLLAQQEDEVNFSDQQIGHVIRDMFMGGSDTTACSIAWVILCYLHYPQHRKKLHEEIDEALGSDGVPNFERKDEMVFTSAFLFEVMRFRSTVNMTYRRSTDNIKIGKYTIPKGTMMLINQLGIHKDPKAWPDPETFDPYRHINDDGSFEPPNKVLPFGMGYRICPGETLARREIFIVFVKLLQNFHITADEKSLPSLEYGSNNLLHSPITYMVTLNPRVAEK